MNKRIVILAIMILLLPLIALGQVAKKPPSAVSFDFMDADVRNVLRLLTQISARNIVIADDVKGKVTLRLDNVPWEDAFDLVLRTADLIKIDEDSVIRVLTVKKFEEDKAKENRKKEELFKEKLERLRLGIDLVSREIVLKYASADEVKKWITGETTTFVSAGPTGTGPVNRPAPAPSVVASAPGGITERSRGLLSDFGVVTTVPWNNRIITIKDVRENIDEIVRRLKELDVAPAQVQIEARIVEASTTFSRDLGVKWSANLTTTVKNTNSPILRDKDITITPSVTTPAVAPVGTVGILIGSATDSNFLSAELSAMEAEGRGKVISNPKVITSNFKEAKINAGREVPYSTAGQYGTNVEFKKAELELRVIPQVIGDQIKLEISAKKNEPGAGSPPPIITREITTKEVIIRDGETVVLGGIYDRTENMATTGVPFLSKIPLIGWLFKEQSRTDNKTELLIFVTPRIIKNLYSREGD
jgi:type IV pilus assembly protein PilQ